MISFPKHDDVGIVSQRSVAKVNQHLGVRPGVDAGIDNLNSLRAPSLFLQQPLKASRIGFLLSQSPAKGSGISKGQDAKGIGRLGGPKLFAARSQRIDMDR